jgi:galactokinase
MITAWTPSEGAARATALFYRTFDAAPTGVWSAPGRVNLIGEHTDYTGGLCLPVALPHRTYVALRPRDDDEVRLVSAQEEPWSARLADVAPGTVRGWGAYVAGVAWALGRRQGFEAAVDSCVPYGAGLSSSAALECAVAIALDELAGTGLAVDDDGRRRLAAACVRAENEIAGAPTGGLDQSASLLCRPGSALLCDFTDGSTRHVPADLGPLVLLVVDTKSRHELVDGQYGARRAACERAAEVIGPLREATLHDLGALDPVDARRVRHVVTENARVLRVVALLEQGRAPEVGPVLDAGHASLRDDYEVSCAELDVAQETAVAAGALGARMVGGGFGGSVLALVPSERVPDVTAAVGRAFAERAWTAPAFLVAEPAGPAGRVL